MQRWDSPQAFVILQIQLSRENGFATDIKGNLYFTVGKIFCFRVFFFGTF
jgi:hypothetical protein